MRTRKPAGWRTGLEGEVICNHRDLCVCRDCQVKYADQVVEVFGCFYWAVDAADFVYLKGLAK